jgi:AcrR family transcriptional regulator
MRYQCMAMASKAAYHHGNLRAALIAAATRLLARDGATAYTLRAVAGAAGVSQAAPYHHFKDKDDLLDAVVAAGFERLAGLQERTMLKERGGYEKLRANGIAYMTFAVTEPVLFRLMFGRDFLRPSFQARYRTVAGRSFALFADACREATAGATTNPALFQLSAWSLAHGLASLLVDRRVDELVRHVLGKRPGTALGRNDIHRLGAAVIDALIAPALASRRPAGKPTT